MKHFRELANRIRGEADLLERRGLEDQARMARSYAEEIEDAIRSYWHEELRVSDAAKENGCSESKMRDMISTGEVPAAGSHPTTIIRADLPCYEDAAPSLRDATEDPMSRGSLLSAAGGA